MPTRKKAAAKPAAKKKAATKKVSKKSAVAAKAVAKKKIAPVKKKAATGAKTTKKAAVKKKAPARTPPERKTSAKKKVVTKKAVQKTASTTPHKRTTGSATAGFSDFTPYKEKKGEEYMNPGQAEHFRSILLRWRQQLMEEVDRTVHHMQDDAGNFPDPNDRATQEEEFALELRTRDRERKLIKKINESLANLESADYGFCEVCGVEIGIRRLEARPTATLCIDCKTLDEIREKQMA